MARRRTWMAAALGACVLATGAGCGSGGGGGDGGGGAPVEPPVRPPAEPAPGQVVGAVEAAGADLAAIAGRLNAVLALGYNTVNPDVVAKQLLGKGGASAPASALFVLDTREPADFAAGHIPGAANVPLRDLPRRLLDDPAALPPASGEGAKEIVVASYVGGDGNMAVLLLNAVRIADPKAQKDAAAAQQPLPFKMTRSLFAGMTSWSFARELTPRPGGNYRFAGDANARPLDKAAVPVEARQLPDLAPFGTDDLARKILIRADAYLRSVPSQHDLQLDGQQLAAMLGDPAVAATTQLLSVRSKADYDKWGHLPGALNIPWQQVANLDKARALPPGATVVAYCYTGHTGAQATMALGILGYKARNYLYGMAGWNLAASGGALRSFDLLKGWDFPLHTTAGDGSLAAYDPPRAGCVGCHASLTAIAYDLWVNPSAAAVAPPSEGEG